MRGALGLSRRACTTAHFARELRQPRCRQSGAISSDQCHPCTKGAEPGGPGRLQPHTALRTCAAPGSPYPSRMSCSQGGRTQSSFMRSRIDSSTALKLFSLACGGAEAGGGGAGLLRQGAGGELGLTTGMATQLAFRPYQVPAALHGSSHLSFLPTPQSPAASAHLAAHEHVEGAVHILPALLGHVVHVHLWWVGVGGRGARSVSSGTREQVTQRMAASKAAWRFSTHSTAARR